MMEYILRIKNISDNLAAIGESVSEMDQNFQLLVGLRADYNSIVASLIEQEDDLSLHSVHSILLIREQRLCLQNTVPESDLVNANIATSQHKNNSNKRHNNRFSFFENKNGPRLRDIHLVVEDKETMLFLLIIHNANCVENMVTSFTNAITDLILIFKAIHLPIVLLYIIHPTATTKCMLWLHL